MQVSFAFHRIEGALSIIIMNLGKFSGLAAETERLEELFSGEKHCDARS